jgi:hypothetical protein
VRSFESATVGLLLSAITACGFHTLEHIWNLEVAGRDNCLHFSLQFVLFEPVFIV